MGDVKGFPPAVFMYSGITNNGYLSVDFGLSDMQNDCPRHPQNIQLRIPVVGYEWYASRLNKLRLSGYSSADAITLLDQMNNNPAEGVIFNQIHLLDSRGIMSHWIEQRSLPRRHSS